MKIFIDLGAFTGDSLERALLRYKGYDRFYAFEPLGNNFELLKRRFSKTNNIVLINAAAYINTGESKLYLGREWGDLGGSLCKNKMTCFKDRFEEVKTLDFSEFIMSNFKHRDKIILKIDIEGTEYELLDKMISDGSIKYISEIYCEWHYDRIGMNYKTHQGYIRRLRKLGFNLVGENRFDEFTLVSNVGKIKLQIEKYKFYYVDQFKNFLRNCLCTKTCQTKT